VTAPYLVLREPERLEIREPTGLVGDELADVALALPP
jgi:hypothetical protein